MNADSEFKNFVSRQQRRVSAERAVDWNKERDNWLKNLEELYGRIAEYLDEYIRNGTIRLRNSVVELNEKDIGAYKAKSLTIVIGGQEITLTPVGTLLIGSKGRVDVNGSAGSSRLVLIDKNISDPRQMIRVKVTTKPSAASPPSPEPLPSRKEIEWAWKIVSRPPIMHFVDMNKESLFEMLMEVSNG